MKIILAKFHQNRLRIVEFLLMVILVVQVSVKSCYFSSDESNYGLKFDVRSFENIGCSSSITDT